MSTLPSRTTASALKAVRVARTDGVQAVLHRASRKLTERLAPPVPELPLFLEDVVTGGPVATTSPASVPSAEGRLLIDVVTTPPGPGSGGHSTIFRLVEHLERSGHRCRLSLYDRSSGDVAVHEAVIRKHWPGVRAEVVDVRRGRLPADAVFATSWQTAHVVARSPAPGARFYLVQDFEPDFYPVSSERLLAEATYSWGFHGVTIGRWLAERLERDYGMACEPLPFGCDTDVYGLTSDRPRSGVVFYAKPDVPRRAFTLGVLALQLFAERHPDEDIHLYGLPTGRLPFRHTHHGVLSPQDLNLLYNSSVAGLSLSLTNTSLVPWEMLASGCIPVVNDAVHNRTVLDNPFVRYADLTPRSLADALSELVVAAADSSSVRTDASRSVATARWEDAGQVLEAALRRELGATGIRRAERQVTKASS